MTTQICRCGQPTTEASYICPSCTNGLWNTLDAIPDLLVDLGLTRTRQRHYGTTTGTSSGDALPWHEAASRSLHDVREATYAIVDRCIAARLASTETTHTSARPSRRLDDAARWLQVRVDPIAAQPWAPTALGLIRVHNRALTVIDHPPEHTYAGPCQVCGADLYTLPDQPEVKCPGCGATEDVAARRSYLLGCVNDQLATATEIARALTSLAMPISSERIRQWKHRQVLEVRSHEHHRDGTTGHPLYRVGDVIDLLLADAERIAG